MAFLYSVCPSFQRKTYVWSHRHWMVGESSGAVKQHHCEQNITTSTMMRVFLAVLLISEVVTSFQLGALKNVHAPASPTTFLLRSSTTNAASSVEKLQADDDDEDDDGFSLTPIQVKVLRKEMNYRKSTRTLTQLYLPPDEATGPFSKETMQSIVAELNKNEMVTVRSISKQEIKDVWGVVERLSMEVGIEMGNKSRDSVFVLDTTGHAATLYSPSDVAEKTIKLRTTMKANNWDKRVKAERDSRGQIVPGTSVPRKGRRGARAD